MAVSIPIPQQQTAPVIHFFQEQRNPQYRVVKQTKSDVIKRLYHADNLDALTTLVQDKDVCGKVNLTLLTIQVGPLKHGISFMPIRIISRRKIISVLCAQGLN